jgi:hypothetical protein
MTGGHAFERRATHPAACPYRIVGVVREPPSFSPFSPLPSLFRPSTPDHVHLLLTLPLAERAGAPRHAVSGWLTVMGAPG